MLRIKLWKHTADKKYGAEGMRGQREHPAERQANMPSYLPTDLPFSFFCFYQNHDHYACVFAVCICACVCVCVRVCVCVCACVRVVLNTRQK